MTPATLLQFYQPEVILWLYSRCEPTKAFDFCFDDGILRQYFEFDKQYNEFMDGKADEFLTNVMANCLREDEEGTSAYKKIETVPMSLLVQLGSVVDFNVPMLETVFEKIGQPFTYDQFKDRLERAKYWLEQCSPENVNRLRPYRNWEVYEALSEEEKKVSRRSELTESLPKTEKTLKERDKDISNRNTALEADKASLSEKKKQRDADRESLRFDSIAEAQSKSDALGKTVSEMKKAYDNAQSALSDSDKKIAGYNASITELSKQLSSDCDLDKEAETKKKTELSEKRAADDDAAKALHTRIESNTKVLANIWAKVGDLDTLEKSYTWLKALSNTANGNISGKEKVMLETYIQMTYFDRIIARANTRFMVMSGGQYELKRRREAENNRSQSGLDLDVIDHYNGTERSVKTLSGGESFKASLSLALGLSDEIQASAGGVKLDTMFVDEGFGSLDEESLDQAMKALSSLADGNRLVGIISHVVDLKNRIDKQIVVEKEKSGGSKACIVL